MILDRRCGRTRITLRFVILSVIMSLLVSGLFLLFIYLSSARGQGQSLSYSKAESVRLSSSNVTVTAPFDDTAGIFKNSTCPKFHFFCRSSGICLELDRRCDGTVDCPKAEDEVNCVCAFRMPPSKFCDKYPDCFDESDESFCSYCPEGYFNCGDGKCIPRKLVCDSKVDCDNFMDENFCFRLSSDASFADMRDGTDPFDATNASRNLTKTGYLMRNRNGAWYPVCANPVDYMQDALASFACVSITSNPLASSTHQLRKFLRNSSYAGDYIYHNQGRFVRWRSCLGDSGLYVTCDDVRCGFNPRHLLPRRPRGRIVGGEVSEPGAWPWHGAVYRNGSYACGATLVSDRWLVSAAHCFIDYRRGYYEVQLGMLRRKSFTPHQKTHRVDRVVPHRRFNVVTLEFDIVMLRLSEPVAFDFWVRPICLPDPGARSSRRGALGKSGGGAYCTAIGWGDTGETEDDSEDLLEVHVPLTETCKRDSRRWLCAGYVEGGRDACQGDSGGPLMCLQDDGISWYIAGVISAGTGCARPDTPGMYTRVVHFLDWIQRVMINDRHQTGKSEHHPLPTCPGWKCAAVGGGYCLKADRVCDGHVDCYDAQDEANCLPGIVNNVSGQPPV